MFSIPALLTLLTSIAINACDLYLFPSVIPNAGRGIFAGRHVAQEEHVENCVNVEVPKAIVHSSQFVNYVYGSSSDRYDMLTIGPGSIYNHHDERSVYYTWTDSNVIDPSNSGSAHANMTGVTFRTSTEVTTGQEMFNYYGADWFQRFTTDKTKSTTSSSVNPYLTAVQIADLETAGHCLSYVTVGTSTIAGAGRGVFAARQFAQGEVVIVSPVLALRKATIAQARRTSTLENYCLGTTGSELLFFPISYGALVNHAKPGNLELSWYDWSAAEAIARAKYHRGMPATSSNAAEGVNPPRPPTMLEKLAMTPSELTEAAFAQLDLAYTATRAIAKGEELFLDYGTTWQQAWSDYTDDLSHWEEKVSVTVSDGGVHDTAEVKRPQFRRTIQMPADMYSPHWFEE